jgi:phosphoglycolate phosphatase-like HAD superfamily hydrolase
MRAASALLPAGGQLWFIGDSPTDVEAARAADALLATIHVCGVLVGQGDGDIVVSEVGQVGDLIASAEAIA